MIPCIVVMNGPPQVGKDTTAKLLGEELQNYTIEKFAFPLEEALSAYSGKPLSSSEFRALREDLKDKPVLKNNLTPRKFMQETSTLIKKYFGEGVFGQMCAERCRKLTDHHYIFITDCGFQKEFDTFIETLQGTMCRVMFLRVCSPGYTFLGDTREWVVPREGIPFDILYNPHTTFDDLRHEIKKYTNKNYFYGP